MPVPARMMSMVELAALGAGELARLAMNGELTPERIGLAMKGAEKYKEAIAAGDVATEGEARERSMSCAGCPARTRTGSLLSWADKGWCGEPYLERLEAQGVPAAERTCGCLVTMTVRGEVAPGPKPWVASERCPRGRW